MQIGVVGRKQPSALDPQTTRIDTQCSGCSTMSLQTFGRCRKFRGGPARFAQRVRKGATVITAG